MLITPKYFQKLLVLFILTGASLQASAGKPFVTMHLLDHTRYSLDKKREPIDSDPKKRFWIDWSKEWRNINDTRSVKGDEAVALHTLLRESLVNSEAQHF